MIEGEENEIRAAQDGSSRAFSALYDRYIAQIYRFILIKVTSVEEAEDLAHEVFLRAWQNIKTYEVRGLPFSSWLYQIARNQIIDHYRTKKNVASIEMADAELVKAPGNVEQDIDQSLEVGRIRTAIRALPPEHQDILIMRFVEDLSYKEIAAALHKNEGAVRVMQHRALKALKKILE